jgi:hypothetical protein
MISPIQTYVHVGPWRSLKNRSGFVRFFLLIAVAAAVSCSSSPPEPQEKVSDLAEPFTRPPLRVTRPWQTAPCKQLARRINNQIIVLDLNRQFAIPNEWVRHHQRFQNNLFVTVSEIDAAYIVSSRWNDLLGNLSSAAFPRNRCVGHFGSSAWFPVCPSYTAIHCRVFSLDDNPGTIRDRLISVGKSEIHRTTGVLPSIVSTPKNAPHRVAFHFSYQENDFAVGVSMDCRIVPNHEAPGALVFLFFLSKTSPCQDVIDNIVRSTH